jgi:hypothetical protein
MILPVYEHQLQMVREPGSPNVDASPQRRECGTACGRRERLGPSCSCCPPAPGKSPRNWSALSEGDCTAQRMARRTFWHVVLGEALCCL